MCTRFGAKAVNEHQIKHRTTTQMPLYFPSRKGELCKDGVKYYLMMVPRLLLSWHYCSKYLCVWRKKHVKTDSHLKVLVSS